MGAKYFTFVLAIAAGMAALIYSRKKEYWTFQTLSLHGALIFFGAMFVWRDSFELRFFDAIAILTIFAVLILPALRIPLQKAGVIHYGFGWIWSGISWAFAPFTLFFNDIKWKTIPQTGWTKNLVSVLRGIAIAAPILVIFGGLFMAADAVFQGIVENTLNINPENLFSHLLLFGFLSWGIAGYLRSALIGTSSGELTDELSITPTAEAPLSITEPTIEEKTEPKEEKAWD